VSPQIPPKIRLWPDVALAAVAALLGAAAAAVCLVFKPVVVVTNDAPAAQNARGVCYIQGSRDRVKGATWVRKRAVLLTATPGEIPLNEDELNTWFAASTHARTARRADVAAPAAAQPDSRPDSRLGFQLDSQLDFRIGGARFQIAAPVTVQTPLGRRTIIVQTRGVFERIPANPGTGMPGVIMYAPRETYAGSLPLHRIPGATARLIGGLLESQTLPGEALAAWQKIDRVTISGRELRITISGATE
jgi:hypothetical protein